LPSPPQTDVTELLSAVSAGRAHAADELLPLVYEELRNLAQAQMAREPSGHTLQPTALVHEAYLRLVKPGSGQEPAWDSRAHFFASAALAMRRILVERARRVAGPKRGGGRVQALGDRDTPAPTEIDLVGLDEALKKFEAHDARKYQVVMLKFFAGLSIEQIAAALSMSPTTVKADWQYARAWLHREVQAQEQRPAPGPIA